jgi:sugar (pentulose or hexulose) kinase
MADAYLLGIDAGTTVVKSVVFDLHGNEAAKAGKPIATIHPRPGWAEHDMHEVWDAVAVSIREALHKGGIGPEAVKGVSMSAQGAGSWFVDKNGRPTRNAVGWADGRAAYIIDRWRDDGTLDRMFEASGFLYYSGSGPGIIVPWFKENEPRVLDRSRAVIWCNDWVRFCLTGEILTDEPDGSIAMMDPQSRRYSDELFDIAGISEYRHLFPPVKQSHDIGGKVTRAAAEKTGLREGTPVAMGAWDCSSTALGAGCVQHGDATSIVGTAGIHLCIADKALVNRAYSLACHAVPGRWLINSMAMTAANNLDWFEREFCLAERVEAEEQGRSKYEVINREVDAVPIGANGVMYLPFLQGERAPFVEPRARAELFGMGHWTNRADLLRAVYEGVALATRHNYTQMEKGVPFDTVRLGGGGAQSEVWTQIIADCTGKTMEVTSGTEFGARGAAINAAVALGIYADHQEAVDRMVSVTRVQEPDLEKTEVYSRIFDLYVKLIERNRQVWVEMCDLVDNILTPREGCD